MYITLNHHVCFRQQEAFRRAGSVLKEPNCESIVADIAPAFGYGNGAKLTDVFQAFTKERGSGSLLHYWP